MVLVHLSRPAGTPTRNSCARQWTLVCALYTFEIRGVHPGWIRWVRRSASLFHEPVRTNGEAAAWGAARDAAMLRCSWDAVTEGRSHSDTLVGCMVWSTTASSSAVRVSRSTCWRSRALNAAIVWAA